MTPALHRLIICGIVLLSSWLPTSSYAIDYSPWSGGTPTGTLSNLNYQTLCIGMAAAYTSASSTLNYRYNTLSNIDDFTASCGVDAQNKSPGGTVGWYAAGSWAMTRTILTCTAPATYDTVTRTCVNNTNACTTATGRAAGAYSGQGGTGSHSLCDVAVSSGDPALPGCLISGSANIAYGDAPNQTWSAYMSFTGGKCVPSGNAPTAPAPVPCPVGQLTGQVNGEDRCVRPGADVPKTSTASGTKTTTNPDGTGNKTDVSQTTTCTISTCSTVTTVTNTPSTAGGVSGTPVTTTQTATCNRGAPGCQTTATTPNTSTTTNTTTGTTTTGTPVSTNGTTTTTTGSNSTTTSTTVAGGGSGSGGDGSTPDICAEHPGSLLCQDAGTAVNGSLSAQPTLYTRKYPDGLTGVWSSRKAELLNTPLVALTSGLQPTISGTGGYPTWSIPIVIGKWNFGVTDVSPPPMVWDFLKVCVILGALFLSRALIFGG